MSLQLLLYWLRLRRDILVSPDDIWWSSLGPDRRMEAALRRHRRGLRLMFRWSPIATCPARDLHRSEYYYRDGQWICGACERLEREVA